MQLLLPLKEGPYKQHVGFSIVRPTIRKCFKINRNRKSLKFTMKFTYIHNTALQLLCQDFTPGSHTIHVLCISFIREWRDLKFKVDSERQIFFFFDKRVHGNFIYSPSFCQISAERKSPKNYFFFVHISRQHTPY